MWSLRPPSSWVRCCRARRIACRSSSSATPPTTPSRWGRQEAESLKPLLAPQVYSVDFDTKYQEEEFFLHVYDKHLALFGELQVFCFVLLCLKV